MASLPADAGRIASPLFTGPAHLAAGSALCQEIAQQGGVVGGPSILQQQEQAAQWQAAAQQAVQVGVPAGQQRLAVQPRAGAGICTAPYTTMGPVIQSSRSRRRRRAPWHGMRAAGNSSEVRQPQLIPLHDVTSPAAVASPLRKKLPCRIAGCRLGSLLGLARG